MSQREKLEDRFLSRPKDFTWDELVKLLEGVGYREDKTGKTGGSRRRFSHEFAVSLYLHKPHPGNRVKLYLIDYITEVLDKEGLL
ncbi:MAG: type II toxin-antitoxin system HicA family toxin [Candidatus Symbiobacter sp.]|nr:type II toxin-antitoxin system HicA family toxin [Candidatus Symbiobacter sp.]